jgi:hypothetical protein
MPRHTPALLFLLLVVVAFSLWFLLKPDPFGDALRTREIATRGLAEYLVRTQPGQRALIVSNPFTQRKETAKAIGEMEQAGLRGLRQGFGKNVTVAAVAFPELKPEARDNPRALLTGVETTTPLSYLVAPDAFDDLAKQHPDCELIVSLIGLPAELSRCESWRASGPPGFALLLPDLRVIGDEAAVRNALKSGKLLALVLAKPGAPDASASSSGDFGAEFEKRFLLVTPENVDQLARSYPGLF